MPAEPLHKEVNLESPGSKVILVMLAGSGAPGSGNPDGGGEGGQYAGNAAGGGGGGSSRWCLAPGGDPGNNGGNVR